MKREFAVLCAVLLMLSFMGCATAPRAPQHPMQAHLEDTIYQDITKEPAPPTPLPSASAELAPSPVPTIDAAWYEARNEQIRFFIRQYRPNETEEEIERDLQRMAIDPDKPMVALTFDDGPKQGITDQILDILDDYDARATFFVLGWRLGDPEKQEILRRAAAQGSEIANHTWSHTLLPGKNYVGVRYEIKNTNQAIFDIIGAYPHCFRPPGGQNDYEAMRVTRENDMMVILWSQSGNVHEIDAGKIAQNVEKQIVDGDVLEDGDIVLLHDTHANMVDAVRIIVPKLISEGYQLVTVWELLNCADQPPVPGKVYDRQQGPIEYH